MSSSKPRLTEPQETRSQRLLAEYPCWVLPELESGDFVEAANAIREILSELEGRKRPNTPSTFYLSRLAHAIPRSYAQRKLDHDDLALQGLIQDLHSTLKAIQHLQERRTYHSMRFEAFPERRIVFEAEPSDQTVETMELGNFEDVAGNPPLEAVADKTYAADTGQKEVDSIDAFLSRPIKIASFSVAPSTSLDYQASVWDLWSKEPSVRAKLRNYSYFRGTLHVRIAVSGTPFHYGRFLLSYQPYPESNDALQAMLGNVALSGTLRPLLLTYLSQAPGAVVIDVNENQPVDMEFPFISHKPMARLFNTTAGVLSAATSYADMEHLGDMFLYSFRDVKSVSATPSNVSFYIYAWVTDVQLGTLTATQIDITTEAKKIRRKKTVKQSSDERETGPIEQITSAGASIAMALSAAQPELAPWALPSAAMLKGASELAAALGWSRPSLVQPPMYVKNEPFRNGATAIETDTTKRIVLDPKQELTIDPHAAASSCDEMTLDYLASTESYFATFDWNDDKVPMTNPIFHIPVLPHLHPVITSTVKFHQPTALSYAAQPFEWWRGDIVYRFEVVCSAYHRGKLAFFYEPNTSQKTAINSALEINKQYMRVLDLQTSTTMEMHVGWAYPRAWARAPTGVLDQYVVTSPGFTGTNYPQVANGYIGVTPLTSLQSPDNSDIYVNVYVRGENMMFNQVLSTHMPTQRVRLEGDFQTRKVKTDSVDVFELNKSSASIEHICHDHFGEGVLSIRSVMKRFHESSFQVSAEFNIGSTDPAYLQLGYSIYPVSRAPYAATSTNTTPWHMFEYYRFAYLGMRGGMKKRLKLNLGDAIDTNTTVYPLNSSTVVLDSPISSPPSAATAVPTGNRLPVRIIGGVSFIPQTNGGIEFELPFYSNNLFVFAFAEDYVGAENTNEMETTWSKRYTASIALPSSYPAGHVIEETAIAEDFTFLRFQGAPYYTTAT